MLTSLFVISVKSYRLSCGFYACQSLVLVSIFATLAPVRRRATADLVRQRLYHQSAAGTVNHDLRCTKYSPEHPGKSVIRSGNDGTARGVNCPALRICRSACEATHGYRAETGAGGSVRSFSAGLLCIVSQRNILRQIFGYCLMENGSHLVLALLAWRAPELVEIGIATDAIFAVIVMVLLARKIWRTHGTLDVNNLTALKG